MIEQIHEIEKVKRELRAINKPTGEQLLKIVQLKDKLNSLRLDYLESVSKTNLTFRRLPKYVYLPKCNLPLELSSDVSKWCYKRVKSNWATFIRIRENKIYTYNYNYKHLDNIELIPISRAEYVRKLEESKKPF